MGCKWDTVDDISADIVNIHVTTLLQYVEKRELLLGRGSSTHFQMVVREIWSLVLEHRQTVTTCIRRVLIQILGNFSFIYI